METGSKLTNDSGSSSSAAKLNEDEAHISQHVQQAALSGGLGEGLGLELTTDYFDIESFLVDQTLVEVMTLDVCPFGGFASQTSPCSLHLNKGVAVKLPLSTARLLHDQGLVTVHMPSIFSESIVLNLYRNPTVVDVGSMHPYYFEFGMKLADLFKDTRLYTTLKTSVEKRLILLMKLACEQVEAEERDLQSRSGLIAEAVVLKPQKNKNKENRLFKTSLGGTNEMNTSISGDTFIGSEEIPHIQSVEASLFLKGLSASEARLFQKRKEECHRAFSSLLF